ncbi:MAG: AAA family ATPase [Alphaproteobacteria bacterium]
MGDAAVTRIGGERLTFGTRKAFQLFSFLAATAPQRWPRARLAALLWSDRDEPQARGSLRQALTAIRRVLPDAARVLVVDGEAVGLDLDDIWVDLHDLRRLSRLDAVPDIDDLAALYRGPLLQDMTPVDPAFGAWLEAERRAIEEAMLSALRHEARRSEAEGDPATARRAARLALEVDAACEESARRLIRLEAAAGDRSAALRAYQQFRDALAERYEAAPEPETEALVARLKLTGATAIASTVRLPPTSVADHPDDPSAAGETASPKLQQRAAVALVVRPPAHAAADTDVEAAHSMAQSWRAAVVAEIERAGGRASRFGATGVLGLFGAEASFGDDGLRAARAALAIRDACVGTIGMAGGMVVIEAGSAGGTAIETASALSRAAEPGVMLIAPDTAGDLAGWIETAPSARFMRLIAMRSLPQTPFIGRRAELGQIETALQIAAEEKRGRVIHLRGEAGIGKTRLAGEAARLAKDQGFVQAVAHVLDFGGRNRRDAIRTMLRALLGVDDDSEARLVEAAAETMRKRLDRCSELDEAVLLDLLDAPIPPHQLALLDAMPGLARAEARLNLITRSVATLAIEHPLFLLFEDVHWADQVTLEGLAALASTTVATPTILVVTTRIEGDRLNAAWRASTGGSGVSTIDLGPMNEREAHALAAAVGGPDERSLAACISRAEGNPLFLEQLLRLRVSGERARPTGAAEPASLRSVAQARLDLLPESSRETLMAASVLGQSFAASALAALMERGEIDREALTAHGMVHGEGVAFRFGHALLREAIYAMLLPSRRRALHRRAADWFAERDPTLRAEHLEAAGAPEAAAAFRDAAEGQLRVYRYADAAALASRGAALARSASERTELLLMQGQALHDLGDMAAAARTFDAARAAALSPLEQARALYGAAAVKRVVDDLDGAFRDVDAGLRLATGPDSTQERARLRHLRGNLLFPLGDAAGCQREHEESLVHAREAEDPALEAAALGGIGDAAYLAGRMTSAYRALGVCVELARQHGFGRIEVANDGQRAVAGTFTLPLADAVIDLERAREATRRVGDRRSEINTFAGTVWALFDLGQYERAVAAAEEACLLVRRLGTRRYEPPFS